jgi:FKBP-type peptidyl-prolyl cis-trans isomerase FklB
MRRSWTTTTVLALAASALTICAQTPAAPKAAAPKPAAKPAAAKPAAKPAAKGATSADQKLSYALGQDVGARFKEMGVNLDLTMFSKGVSDMIGGKPPMQPPEESGKCIEAMMTKLKGEQAQKVKDLGEKNLKEGEAFLAKNAAEDKDVKTTPSGLQYKVITEGTGASPKATDTVTVQYRGMLLDGTEFDSSYKRGQPATFPCSGVIPGWVEALQLMKTGGKYRLFIPSKLAYAERGAGQAIAPNSTLIFEVELVSIGAPAAAPQPK